MTYAERLRISLDGDRTTEFFTHSGLHVATGYVRIVIGDRGPYIEFSDSQINKENIHIPAKEMYRLTADYVYYDEYRSNQDSVKLYYQKRTVDYADYKIGLWYVSPFALKTKEHEAIIPPLRKKKTTKYQIDYFD